MVRYSGAGHSASWRLPEPGTLDAYAPGLPARLAATGAFFGATEIAATNALLSGLGWTGAITYSFPDSRLDYEPGYAEVRNGFAPVSAAQMQAARYIFEGKSASIGGPRMALTPVEGFTNASLTDYGSQSADIRIGRSFSGEDTAYAYLPSSHPYGGDVWFGRSYDYSKPKVGGYEFATMIHELGHALGLKHAHEAGGVSGEAIPRNRDSLEYSVMTYRSYVPFPTQNPPENGYTNETYGFPQTYMMYDIAALQAMYGADFAFRKGNTVYRWNPTTGETYVDGVGQGAPGDGMGGPANRIFLTIWDGGGSDTYDLSNYTRKVTINLNPGGHVAIAGEQRADLGGGHKARGNIFNALQYQNDPRSLIENANGGSGSDVLKGNAAKNKLKGNRGNDIINGGDGNDALWGGPGKDAFVFNTPLNPRSNVDRILDFSPVADTIRLENGIFTSLTKTGKLAKGYFFTGAGAHDPNDRIIYNKKTGALIYDSDGTGETGPVKFAQLKAGLNVTAADFFVV